MPTKAEELRGRLDAVVQAAPKSRGAREARLIAIEASAALEAAERELGCVVTHLRQAGLTADVFAERPWQGVALLRERARGLDEDLVATQRRAAEEGLAERERRRVAEGRLASVSNEETRAAIEREQAALSHEADDVVRGLRERIICLLEVREVGWREAEGSRRRAEAAEGLLDCRAGKLLKKGKPFVVVACDEEYYMRVYAMIREDEQRKGRWTEEDEAAYRVAEGDWNEAHYTRGSSYEQG